MKNLTKKNKTVKTMHGIIKTPFFMPIATRGVVKGLNSEELAQLGAQIILGNTYHLWLRPGLEIIKKAKGLHNFMNWQKPILTDSGGFQVFSLSNLRKITEEGVSFRSTIDGQKLLLTPEKSIEIQLVLGSDIIMVLDECTPYPCGRKEAEIAVDRSARWAKRCKDFFIKKIGNKKVRPLLFGIIQGSTFRDLRERSVRQLLAIGFDGYAIGGMAPKKQTSEVIDWVLPFLPKDKPWYVMGAGKPEEIVNMVNKGFDMFDCVIPTREARHGRIYKLKSQISHPTGDHPKGGNLKSQNLNFYEVLQITNSKFKNDFKPIDKSCDCFACKNYSRAYLRHLFQIKDALGQRLATIHNLRFYLRLMEKIRL